jgi:hypothetical protein
MANLQLSDPARKQLRLERMNFNLIACPVELINLAELAAPFKSP